MKALRSTPKMKFLGDGEEVPQLPEVHLRTIGLSYCRRIAEALRVMGYQ